VWGKGGEAEPGPTIGGVFLPQTLFYKESKKEGRSVVISLSSIWKAIMRLRLHCYTQVTLLQFPTNPTLTVGNNSFFNFL
jgi:hypothetical protein